MMFTHEMLQKLKALIREIADRELMSRFSLVESHDKADGSLLTEADLSMQNSLLTALAHTWPQIALLGEEMPGQAQQQLLEDNAQALWILDPLDGTSNFSAGIPFFAVSIALMVQGRIVAGVVYDPARQETFSALRGQGAWLDGTPLQAPETESQLQRVMAMVDLKRLPPGLVKALADKPPYRSQRSFGSVALDWCWLAAGRVQVYIHGGQKLWDYAAGELILQEAGGCGGVYHNYQGKRVTRATLQPKIGLAASSQALFDIWFDWVWRHVHDEAGAA